MHYRQRLTLTHLLWLFVLISTSLVSVLWYNNSHYIPALPNEVPVSEQVASIAALPLRLIIPSINVDAAIQLVGTSTKYNGAMDVPDNFTDVGWYKYGTTPGMEGSAVITGHLNGKHLPEAVFFHLNDLAIGAEVTILDEAYISHVFKVVKILTYSPNDSTLDIFQSNDEKVKLNLITCEGEWLPQEHQYNKRTVVFTELVPES